MKNLTELSITDLKALFDYFSLIIKDCFNENGTIRSEYQKNIVINTEPKLTAVNNELKKRINSICF